MPSDHRPDPPEPTATDVVVVGGGPAGSAAAVGLRRAGLSVAVLDKATFPRDKACGDGLTVGALRRLDELGLDPASVPSWHVVHDVVLRTPSGREVTFPLPTGPGTYAAVARRVELDAALLDLARAAGATVHDGAEVVGVEPAGDHVVVTTRDGTRRRAGYVVAADGMWSATRRLLGLDTERYMGDWHAFRQYVRGVSPRAADELFVSFEPDFLPGYFWSFPVGDGEANIGFGIRRGGAHPVGSMGALWREVLRRPHIRAWLGPHAEPEGPPRAWPIPARPGDLPLHAAGGRVIFVGDAAAVTDALTGEGIGQALATGSWAATAIVDRRDHGPLAVALRYEDVVRDELVPDHRMSSWLSSALSHRKGVRIAVALAGATPWTRRNFARWLFEDYPRAVVLTPRRWRRGMFTGPGAFDRAEVASPPGQQPLT